MNIANELEKPFFLLDISSDFIKQINEYIV